METTAWDAIEICTEYAIGYRVGAHHVDFDISMVAGHQQGATGVFDVPVYVDAEDQMTDDFALAERFATGSVKWDGCSNWDFHTSEVLAHFCGVDDIEKHVAALRAAYAITARVLPTWDAAVAE